MTSPSDPPNPLPDDPRIAELRAAIDDVNADLARLLARRTALVDAIGALKRARGVPLRDEAREAAQIAAASAAVPGLAPEVLDAVFSAIFASALRRMAGG